MGGYYAIATVYISSYNKLYLLTKPMDKNAKTAGKPA